MAGRKPTPTAQKIVTGNPGHRALNKSEPTPAPEIPVCPDHLDTIARAEWDRITPELLALGILTRIDRAALSAYCSAWSRWVEAENNLRKTGTLIKTPSGYPIQNPYLGIANTAIDMMRKFLTEFGMTPSSRSRIHAAPPGGEKVDPFDALDAPPPAKPGAKVQ
jgi:P27 family predicted phage terminase small subunit